MALASDCLSRSALRELAVATLTAAGTAAQGRVYSPRTWSQRADQLPALMVTTPAERKESLGPGIPQFNSVITLAVMARVQGAGIDAVAKMADAENVLETLCAQAERAMLCTPNMIAPIQQFLFVQTEMLVSMESELVIGEGTVIFGCQVPQLYEPDTGVLLNEINITIPASDTGAPVVVDTYLPQ